MQKSNIIYANYKPLLLKPTTTKEGKKGAVGELQRGGKCINA